MVYNDFELLEAGDLAVVFEKHIKNSLITIISLGSAFGLSLLFQYVFDVREHITTVFVFAVFLISFFTEGYNIRNLVATMLDAAGYQTILTGSCSSAQMLYASHLPDLII